MSKFSIQQVGNVCHQITSTRDNPQRYRVYLIYGLCPSINTGGGGGRMPYIVVHDERGTA